jgi:hypothetical protein
MNCPIRIEIIHGGLNIYLFYHGLALYADILPFAIAQGKIFGIKGQPVVKSVYRLKSMNNTKKKVERTCLGTGTNMWRC